MKKLSSLLFLGFALSAFAQPMPLFTTWAQRLMTMTNSPGRILYVDASRSSNLAGIVYTNFEAAFAASKPGDTIDIAEGNYTNTSEIVLMDRQTIRGRGKATKLFRTDTGTKILLVPSNNVVVQDLSLHSLGTGNGIQLGFTNTCTNAYFRNLYCQGVYDCVTFGSSADGHLVDKLHFDNVELFSAYDTINGSTDPINTNSVFTWNACKFTVIRTNNTMASARCLTLPVGTYYFNACLFTVEGVTNCVDHLIAADCYNWVTPEYRSVYFNNCAFRVIGRGRDRTLSVCNQGSYGAEMPNVFLNGQYDLSQAGGLLTVNGITVSNKFYVNSTGFNAASWDSMYIQGASNLTVHFDTPITHIYLTNNITLTNFAGLVPNVSKSKLLYLVPQGAARTVTWPAWGTNCSIVWGTNANSLIYGSVTNGSTYIVELQSRGTNVNAYMKEIKP